MELLRGWRDSWGADWIHALDTVDPPVSQRFEVRAIPTLVILDKDGGIGFRHVGLTPADTLKREISELLAK